MRCSVSGQQRLSIRLPSAHGARQTVSEFLGLRYASAEAEQGVLTQRCRLTSGREPVLHFVLSEVFVGEVFEPTP